MRCWGVLLPDFAPRVPGSVDGGALTSFLASDAAPPQLPDTPRVVPSLAAHVHLPASEYLLGEPGEERVVEIAAVSIGAFPVTTALVREWVSLTGTEVATGARARFEVPELDDHPATGLTYDEAERFCRWAAGELAAPVRLPTGDEWEAAARGADGRPWPWGASFDERRCNSAEALMGSTMPVGRYPDGASPFGARDMAGNVWEWVDEPADGGWRAVRGGCWLDHAWGVRACRSLAADPQRATTTTGFRIAFREEGGCPSTSDRVR